MAGEGLIGEKDMSGSISGLFLPPVQALRKIRLRERSSKRDNIHFRIPLMDRFTFAFPFADTFEHACRARRDTEWCQFVRFTLITTQQ